MASIQKRGKSYQFTVSRLIGGKQKPIRKGGFRTKKEAELAADDIELQLAKGFNPIPRKVVFAEYFEKWFKLYKAPKVTSVTLKHYEYSLKAIKEYFKETAIQDIRRHDYQLFLNAFGATRAKETVAKTNGHIKSCVKDALEDRIIQVDFTNKTTLIWKVPAKKPYEKHLNFFDSKRLLKSLWSNLDKGLGYSLLLLALTSGMRFEELVGLTRKDFDFHNFTIRINKTWGYKKNAPRGFGPTKNEQSNRVIHMDKKTMEHFEALLNNMPVNVQQLVFYSSSSKYQVISNTDANKLLRKVLEDLNINPITVHGLRHTHASILLYKGASIQYVSERLGHSDIQTTLKLYTHVLKELRAKDEKITVDTFQKMLA
ncbi:site-specific integrase [Sporolactobacillus sp. THM7-7]|nr:site-specific integrase [Sporolactobacillus sp. THM7-7]